MTPDREKRGSNYVKFEPTFRRANANSFEMSPYTKTPPPPKRPLHQNAPYTKTPPPPKRPLHPLKGSLIFYFSLTPFITQKIGPSSLCWPYCPLFYLFCYSYYSYYSSPLKPDQTSSRSGGGTPGGGKGGEACGWCGLLALQRVCWSG